MIPPAPAGLARWRPRAAAPRAGAAADLQSALRTASWWLLVASVSAYTALSSSALYELGVPYDTPGGSFPVKIHLGTYLLLLAWVTGAAGQGNPLAVALRQARQHPLPVVSLLSMVAVFAWAAGQHGAAGLAFIIDTLCMPPLALLTLLLHPRRRHRWLLQWLLALLLINALLGIGESATRTRLVPVFGHLNAYIEEPFFRASALLGHPLMNALTTVTLLPAVLSTAWRPAAKLAALALLTVALLAFGGRTAMAGALLYVVALALWALWVTVNGRVGYTGIAGGIIATVATVSALGTVAVVTGLGERIFRSLTWDNSANVRLKIWDALDYLNGTHAWLGHSMTSIERISLRIGIDPQYEAIENYWLYMLLLLGALGFVLFCLGVFSLLAYLWRQSHAPLRLAMVVFLFVSSGANTLSAKSVVLVLLVVAVQCAAAAQARPGLRPAALPRTRPSLFPDRRIPSS